MNVLKIPVIEMHWQENVLQLLQTKQEMLQICFTLKDKT